MESPVCSFRTAFTGEHSRRIFFRALERIDTAGKWKLTRYILLQVPPKNISPSFISWCCNLRYLQMRKRFRMCLYFYLLIADLVDVKFIGIGFPFLFPLLNDLFITSVESCFGFCIKLLQAFYQAIL